MSDLGRRGLDKTRTPGPAGMQGFQSAVLLTPLALREAEIEIIKGDGDGQACQTQRARQLGHLRLKLVEQVRGVFNDVESGQQPVPPSDEALFARDTPIRMVHADIVAMMVGGIRGLLLQMLHPHALHGF